IPVPCRGNTTSGSLSAVELVGCRAQCCANLNGVLPAVIPNVGSPTSREVLHSGGKTSSNGVVMRRVSLAQERATFGHGLDWQESSEKTVAELRRRLGRNRQIAYSIRVCLADSASTVSIVEDQRVCQTSNQIETLYCGLEA